VGRICPQAGPAWLPVAAEFLQYLVAGNASAFNVTQVEQQLQAASLNAPAPQIDSRMTEDCLFLDVIVPKKVFDGTRSRIKRRQSSGAPVLVWSVEVVLRPCRPTNPEAGYTVVGTQEEKREVPVTPVV
jgi:hypothetical protein